MRGELARKAREIAATQPAEQRLLLLARFGSMAMAAGHVDAAQAFAEQVDDGLDEARWYEVTYPAVTDELGWLESWIESSGRPKPDPRQDGRDLADLVAADPDAMRRIAISAAEESVQPGSRTISDAFEELCRRDDPARAMALLDGVRGTAMGQRARFRAGMRLKRDEALCRSSGVDPERLISDAIDEARRMDRERGTGNRRTFLAGIALLAFNDTDHAYPIMREVNAEGHAGISPGARRRLAQNLIEAGRHEDACAMLAAITAGPERDWATSSLLPTWARIRGIDECRAFCAGMTSPAAIAQACAALAQAQAATDKEHARDDLAEAFAALARMGKGDGWSYAAITAVLSACAVLVFDPAPVIGLLSADSPYPVFRLRLAEHLAGAMGDAERVGDGVVLASQLDPEAEAIMLMRLSLA